MMMIDAHQLPADAVVETDVCIVGTGPAGLTLAREFINQNFRVCLLESGDFELPNPDTASLSEVETLGDFVQVEADRRNRRFGGNSSYWSIKIAPGREGLRHRPLDEVDFEKRDWLPHSGWPFDRQHLLPYYKRAQTVFQMETLAYDAADWEDAEQPQLPFMGDRLTTRMFQFSPNTTFHLDYKEEVARSRNVTTYYNANAVELETDESGQTVKRVKVACIDGPQFWVSARLVILAAGGLETTHLLLLSKQGQMQGLGNEHDLVGRFFMDHPLVHGGYIVPFDRQIFNQTALYDMRQVRGTTVMGAITLTDEVMRREKLLNLAAWIFPRPKRHRTAPGVESLKELLTLRGFKAGPSQALRHMGNVVTGLDDLAGSVYDKVTRKPQPLWSNLSTGGWSHLQPNRDRVYGVFDVLHITEQAPHRDSRVVLGTRTDKLGRRMVQMQTSWHPDDIDSIKRGQQVFAEELERAGIGRFVIEREGDLPELSTAGVSHHMGTTRMHGDPKQGVVNEHCRVHSVSNLYVASSSVFPTGGYANPTLTIVAMALRLADHVKTVMAEKLELSGIN